MPNIPRIYEYVYCSHVVIYLYLLPMFFHLHFLHYKPIPYEGYVAFACTYASILSPERYHLVYVQ